MKGRVNKSSVFPAMSSNAGMTETTLGTTFGSFMGAEENGVRKFLGIQYAQVKNWLAAPELITSYDDEVVDATQFG